jgi:hypothetical protein
MDNKKLAEKIVKAIENETTDLDMIEGVVELLDMYYPKVEDSKPSPKGEIYIVKRAGTMEMNTIGTFDTKKDAFDCVMDYTDELEDWDGNPITDFDGLLKNSDVLWEWCEMQVEVVILSTAKA